MEIIKGYIGHFVYRSDETGYAVFELVCDSKNETCVGTARGFGEGETVELTGEYVVHPIYKKQFKFSDIKALAPEDKVAIERYLGSGAIKGMGEALAKRVVKAFGDDTFRIAQEEPERLAEIKGISLKKAMDIGAQIAQKRDMRDAMIFLQQYGISQNLSNKIYKKYGLQLYEVIKENPYRLAEDIEGVGFKIADDIAKKSGISVDSDYRIRCGLLHTLLQKSYDGHCYYPKNELFAEASDMLSLDGADMETHLMNLVMDRKLIVKKCNDEERVYLSSYYYEEVYCANKLMKLKEGYDDAMACQSPSEILHNISMIEKGLEITLDELQRDAVEKCMKSGVFVLSGGPGTGKTTTINSIISYIVNEGLQFMLAAPTGRAAKRMTEMTGYEAKTIHRLLEINGDISEERRSMYFERNEENPLEADVIIVDEMSMVDIHLMKALLNAISVGTKLVLVGDSNQLSSVGPGQVLQDILESEVFESVRLEKIFRQDEDSHIITYAHKINNGEDIDFTQKYTDFFLLEKDQPEIIYNYIEQLVRDKVPKQFGINMLDTQILTPMRKGALGVEVLNAVLQERLNPASPKKVEHEVGENIFREGDKVMQIKNNYDIEWEIIGNYNIAIETGNGVFNGDVGRIKEINEYLKIMTVLFDDGRVVRYSFEELDELELAYAITIHKSQGTEYPVVIIPVIGGPRMLLTRNLFYTGVTRARESVILLGSSESFLSMIRTDITNKRYTSLKERIIEMSEITE